MTDHLIWVDIETTGLDERQGHILELALIVTDGDLNEIEDWDWVVAPPEGWRQLVHPEAAALHEHSNLFVELDEAYLDIDQVASLARTVLEPYKGSPVAGSSVHFDRRWILEKAPELDEMFHYRNVDVSTVKELARRWYPGLLDQAPVPRKRHRALDDIRDSIEELKFYRTHIFS